MKSSLDHLLSISDTSIKSRRFNTASASSPMEPSSSLSLLDTRNQFPNFRPWLTRSATSDNDNPSWRSWYPPTVALIDMVWDLKGGEFNIQGPLGAIPPISWSLIPAKTSGPVQPRPRGPLKQP